MARITDPARDLLFGLLAPQTGLINQGLALQRAIRHGPGS
jgi:hypothetical protein